MKKLFAVPSNSLAVDYGLLIIRVGVGLMMLTHGLPKMEKLFSDEPVQFASVFGMSASVSLSLAVFSEVLCSLFLIFGFASRIVVIPLLVTMLVAVFIIHGSDPFAKKEMGTLYLVAYSAIFLAGPGRFSVDYLINSRISPIIQKR